MMWRFFAPESDFCLTKKELDLLKPYIAHVAKIHSGNKITDSTLAKMFISENDGHACLSFSNLTEEEVGVSDTVAGAIFNLLQNKLIATEPHSGRPTLRHRPLDVHLTKPLDFDATDKEIYIGFRIIDQFTFDLAINKLKKLYPEVEIINAVSNEGINLR